MTLVQAEIITGKPRGNIISLTFANSIDDRRYPILTKSPAVVFFIQLRENFIWKRRDVCWRNCPLINPAIAVNRWRRNDITIVAPEIDLRSGAVLQ